jgi:cell division protein ZapA (FtsZ GTPase activity inhibitor)
MAVKPQGIRVEIFDQSYMLRSDSDEQYTQELARSVDATMRSIGEKTHTFDSLRLAVLTALHFADECERIRARHARLEAAVLEKTQRCNEALDAALRKAS